MLSERGQLWCGAEQQPLTVVESELRTTTESTALRTSRLFKLALCLEQGSTMLPFLDIPLKRLGAVSTQRRGGGRERTGLRLQEERTKEGEGGRWRFKKKKIGLYTLPSSVSADISRHCPWC